MKKSKKTDKKKSKVKTRKVTLVIPETAYQFFKQMAVLKSQAAVATEKGLTKVSDVMRDTLTEGLVSWKRINQEATKRLQKKAKEDMKELDKKK